MPNVVEVSWVDDTYPIVPRPATVDINWLVRYEVDTMLMRLAVETKFIKLAVETKFWRLGTEIKGRIDEANSWGSTKLLMYLSSPAVVEMRLGDESKLRRFWVETKLFKLAVDTKLRRLGVETTPGTEER
jgi:hypothetical protein